MSEGQENYTEKQENGREIMKKGLKEKKELKKNVIATDNNNNKQF